MGFLVFLYGFLLFFKNARLPGEFIFPGILNDNWLIINNFSGI